MNKLEILTTALAYIEDHLDSDMKTIDIAASCYCSKSSLEKLFRFINNISIHDYIIRRRMTCAAHILELEPSRTLLDIATAYGYSSNEAFSRAFSQVWNTTPSEYRKNPRHFELFPRFLCPSEIGENYMYKRKNVDISELYDLFMERKECYFVCFDIKQMVIINEVSDAAGDLAILETFNRICNAIGEDDVAFRIGGDEFTVLTCSLDVTYAKAIADKVLKLNGVPFNFEDKEIPLSLYAIPVKFEPFTGRYKDLFSKLHETIHSAKE